MTLTKISTAGVKDDAVTQAKINVPISNRNLIINGAMQCYQRGQLTSEGFSVDRMRTEQSTLDENVTTTQGTVASGTTPYSLGFRNTWKIQNGNQTSSALNDVRISLQYKIEAQDLANSGWNYTSSSNYITLSLWVKSSVAQNFYGMLQSYDGTSYNYPFETGSLTANTWTKVTKTIPGNSNLQFDLDNDNGMKLELNMIRGVVYTDSGVSLNTWAAYATGTRSPDQATTWYSTNDATFEITGLQLEVGSVATDFEHRSFGEELALCQRYYQKYQHASYRGLNFIGRRTGSNTVVGAAYGFPPMRTAATSTINGGGAYRLFRFTDGATHTPSNVVFSHESYAPYNVLKFTAAVSSYSSGDFIAMGYTASSAGTLELDAEL